MPRGWKKGEAGDGVTCFESGDSTKGIYVSVWKSSDPSAAEALERFERVKRTALLDMNGYAWSFPNEYHEATQSKWLLDAYAEAKSYRIVNFVLVRFPVVLSAGFHDYDCRKYSESAAYFEPIIASLQINEA